MGRVPSINLFQKRFFSRTGGRLASYGFIGLGQMGYQMAGNLQAKLSPSDQLCVFDIDLKIMQKFAAECKKNSSISAGARVGVAENAPGAVRDADFVITVLPEPTHVKAVYDEIVSADLPVRGRTFIDCSTIDPTTSRAVGALIDSHNRASPSPSKSSSTELGETASIKSIFVDAPMSGGIVGAAAGTLTFMLGATPDSAAIVTPILQTMGKRVAHCGPPGSGLVAKLANNYVLGVANIATAEAMNFGMRWGLDANVLTSVLAMSTGRCWPVEVNNPVPGVVPTAPASRDYKGGFGIRLMAKDLRLAATAAKDREARLELAERVRQVYADAIADERCADRDFSVLYRWLGGKE
ncbi:hypothetical protein Cpir12675_006189 [Ceratocystis pirilliformis]|uniref:3-hydroxyisobutyrate dehydrogenase n=1 Tax=Ceratocystis pirilliformis TaxID=259994 RepID=A0ABR3YJP8_9PEZI